MNVTAAMAGVMGVALGAWAAALPREAGQAAPTATALRPHVLVPVAGTWNVAYEEDLQVVTIDGTAAPKPPDADAARTFFGADAGRFVEAQSGPGAFPLAVARGVTNFADGRIGVEFKLIDGATDQTAGIVFNLKGDGTYTYARYNTKDGNVAVWKFENGARALLQHGEQHEQLPRGEWHRLEVVIKGRHVTAVANGRLTVQYMLDGPVSGRVGLWTKTDSVTAFRRYTVSH